MSISRKILDEISKLNLSEEDEKALIGLLNIEDNGSNKFNADYDLLMKQYLANKGETDG